MRFDKLSFENIKNISSSGEIELGPITVFTGPSRSGKSAAMEASSLAATNSGLAIGSSVEKQKLLILNGYTAARARMYGDKLKAEWRIYSTRHWHAECNGLDYSHPGYALSGMLPTTAKDFLALTGEEKWKLVERVIGKFEEKEPEPTSKIEREIKSLEAENASRAYSGLPVEILQQEIENIEQFLKEQESLAKHAGYKKQRTQQAKDRIAQLTKDLDGLNKMLIEDLFKLEEVREKKGKMEASLAEVLEDPSEEMMQYGDTPYEAAVNLGKAFYSNISKLSKIAGSKASKEIMTSNYEEAIEELQEWVAPLIGTSFTTPDMSKFEELTGVLPSSVAECKKLVEDITGSFNAISERVGRWKAQLPLIEGEISKLNGEIDQDESEYDKIVGPMVIAEKKSQLEKLRRDAGDAAAYQKWLSGVAERTEKILELEQKLDAAKVKIVKYKEAKAEYLNSASGTAVKYANEVLNLMGLPEVVFAADMRGSRSTISITVGGTDLSVLAGSERVIYGSLVLWSIIHSISPEVPLIWIEAAEIDLGLLSSFVNAISLVTKRNDLQGNVFIASWADCRSFIYADNVRVVDFPSKIS